MQFLRELSKQIPKLFKYLVPGLLFVVLCVFSFPKDSEPLLLKLIAHHPGAFLVLGGIGIYCIHRLLFWIIDELALKQYNRDFWAFLTSRFVKTGADSSDGVSTMLEHMNYRWEIIHTCLIMAELLFVFGLFAADGSPIDEHKEPIIVCAVVLFSIAAGLYVYFGKMELEKLGLAKPATKPKKQAAKSAPRKKTSRK
jgi:hypothetical protein